MTVVLRYGPVAPGKVGYQSFPAEVLGQRGGQLDSVVEPEASQPKTPSSTWENVEDGGARVRWRLNSLTEAWDGGKVKRAGTFEPFVR